MSELQRQYIITTFREYYFASIGASGGGDVK